jgi:hypothetical protein
MLTAEACKAQSENCATLPTSFGIGAEPGRHEHNSTVRAMLGQGGRRDCRDRGGDEADAADGLPHQWRSGGLRGCPGGVGAVGSWSNDLKYSSTALQVSANTSVISRHSSSTAASAEISCLREAAGSRRAE